MELFKDYLDGHESAYDEMFDSEGLRGRTAHSHREPHLVGQGARSFGEVTNEEVRARAEGLATSYLEQGVTLDIGGDERAFPLDIMPG